MLASLISIENVVENWGALILLVGAIVLIYQRRVPGKPLLLIAVGLLTFGQLLDGVDELPGMHELPDLYVDWIGRCGGVIALTLWTAFGLPRGAASNEGRRLRLSRDEASEIAG